MTWLQRYRLRSFLASSLWVIPVAGMTLGLLLAPVLRRLDASTHWALFNFGPEGARAVLSGLIGSIFTFVVFVLSILLLAVQIASANLSPRVIAGILAHRPVRVCLGLMVFTFVYGLAVLGRIEATVPQLPVAVVIVSCLASIVAFLYLIDHVARWLRPVSVVTQVAREGARVIEALYPRRFGESAPLPQSPEVLADLPVRQTVASRRGGVVLAFDGPGLRIMAEEADAVIELVPRVGDFVAEGGALFRVLGTGPALDERRLLESLALGSERTIEQDPAFSFRIIVDIAAKALSPAINDPTTAVLALDQLHHLLHHLGARELEAGFIRDRGRDRRVRFAYGMPTWEDYVELAVTEIRQFGATSAQVPRRLKAMLEDLIAALPPARRPALETELRRLQRSVERSYADPEDQAQAARSDSQGFGGHPSSPASSRRV